MDKPVQRGISSFSFVQTEIIIWFLICSAELVHALCFVEYNCTASKVYPKLCCLDNGDNLQPPVCVYWSASLQVKGEA